MFDNLRKLLFGDNNSRNSSNFGFGFKSRSRMNNRCIYKLVSFDQAKTMIENNDIMLIDVRTENEYDFMHIRNAVNIPVEDIQNHMSEISYDNKIMVYCASGARSKKAIQVLNNIGYNNVYIWEYGALATFPFRELIEYGEKK